LISLNLSSTKLSALSALPLFSALRTNQTLIDLNLSSEVESNQCNKLGPAGAKALARALAAPQRYLCMVNVKGNMIGNEGFVRVCQAMGLNEGHLESLNVERNQINHKGIKEFVEVIRRGECKLK